MDNLRTPAGVHFYLLLGRTAYEGRRERLPCLPVQTQLAVVITFRVLDLYLGIRAANLNFVISLLHISGEIRE